MNTVQPNNDPQLIRQHGDVLERTYADRILNSIPTYATIWATYIGNDGAAGYLPMPGADQAAQTNRAKLWERLYTLYESLALCWSLEEEFREHENINTPGDYIQFLNSWTAFYAHLGRIFDMAQDVADQLNHNGAVTPIKEFFESRCIVLHGPKVPLKWVDNALASPPLGEGQGQWHDKMSWDQLTPEQFNFVTNNVTDILRKLEPLVEVFLAQVFALIRPKLSLTPLDWTQTIKGQFDVNPHLHAVPLVATQSSEKIPTPSVHNVSGFSNLGKARPISPGS